MDEEDVDDEEDTEDKDDEEGSTQKPITVNLCPCQVRNATTCVLVCFFVKK
jgi:hypothetical protein